MTCRRKHSRSCIPGKYVKVFSHSLLWFFCPTSSRRSGDNILELKILGTKGFKTAFCFFMENHLINQEGPPLKWFPSKLQSPTTGLKPNQRETANKGGTTLLPRTEVALYPLLCLGGTSAGSGGLRGAGQGGLNHVSERKITLQRDDLLEIIWFFHHCFPICSNFVQLLLFYLWRGPLDFYSARKHIQNYSPQVVMKIKIQ